MKAAPAPISINWLKTSTILRWVLIFTWTLILGISLFWNITLHNRTVEEQARIIARTAFEKDVLYRKWNTGHGGVYVFITPDSQPNPYLKDVPNRDLTVTTGEMLTMINPAYMSRQVFELQEVDMGVYSHITSLKPIRPANAADAWETAALQAFEAGDKEISGITQADGKTYLRLMQPLMVEEKCLKCHATQGYSVGQVRGGISETVPLAPMYDGRSKRGKNLDLCPPRDLVNRGTRDSMEYQGCASESCPPDTGRAEFEGYGDSRQIDRVVQPGILP